MWSELCTWLNLIYIISTCVGIDVHTPDLLADNFVLKITSWNDQIPLIRENVKRRTKRLYICRNKIVNWTEYKLNCQKEEFEMRANVLGGTELPSESQSLSNSLSSEKNVMRMAIYKNISFFR